MVLFYVFLGVYLLAVNFYGLTLMRFQRQFKEREEGCAVSDGKILFTAILGGSLGIYLYMLTQKYRLKSAVMMIVVPLIMVVNVYLAYLVIVSNFSSFFPAL